MGTKSTNIPIFEKGSLMDVGVFLVCVCVFSNVICFVFLNKAYNIGSVCIIVTVLLLIKDGVNFLNWSLTYPKRNVAYLCIRSTGKRLISKAGTFSQNLALFLILFCQP